MALTKVPSTLITGAELLRRNRLCNGDFRVDSINGGAAVTPAASGYIADNCSLSMSQASKITAQRVADSLVHFPYSERLTVASAVTPGASDYFFMRRSVEGLDMADAQWGTANAKPITISFTVKVSSPGTYAFAVQNASQNRSYVWTQALVAGENLVVKTIPGDTTGDWAKDNTLGLRLVFDLGTGSNYVPDYTNAWKGGLYISAAGAFQFIGHAGITYEVSGVQVEVGEEATAYEVLPYEQAEMWCQRYHPMWGASSATTPMGIAAGASGTKFYAPWHLKTRARVEPSGIVVSSAAHFLLGGGVSLTPSAVDVVAYGKDTCLLDLTVTVGGVAGYIATFRAQNSGAKLRLTGAEL